MAAESLREELMALAGVAEADVDEDADSPSGVRVRLEPDADARLVGVEVQRVLASHGLRSRITAQEDAPEEADEPAAPETPPDEATAEIPPVPSIPPPPLTPPPVAPVDEPDAAPAAPVAVPPATPAPAPTPVPGSGLAAVSVEESADGVSVTATAGDGRTVTQRAEASEDGMYSAAVAAAATLAEGEPPEILAVTPMTVDGSGVVTVVLARSDGSRVAGAAVVGVSRAYAAGRATWTALKGS